MKSLFRLFGPVLLGWLIAVPCDAADFSLQTIPLLPGESFALPGVSTVLLCTVAPESLRGEPTPHSERPAYGVLDVGLVFRVDESKGTGHGYDRLLLDLNGNGDLRDEKSYPSLDTVTKAIPTGMRVFGPIRADWTTNQGGWRPDFYAGLSLYSAKNMTKGKLPVGSVVGALSIKPASYVRGEIEIDGIRETIGLVDGNGNLKLGDFAGFSDGVRLRGREWEWLRADYMFRDKDHSGTFLRRPVQDELELLSKPIYLAGRPFSFSFSDGAKLRVDPILDLGALSSGTGARLESLVLLSKRENATWQVLVPQVVSNLVSVPPGVYRLFSCVYSTQRGKDRFIGHGYVDSPGEEFQVGLGQTIPLACGPPLKVKLECALDSKSTLPLIDFADPSRSLIKIRASLCGAGNEVYAAFYRSFKASEAVVPRFPRYEISGRWYGKISGALQRENDGSFSKIVQLPAFMSNQMIDITVTFDLRAIGLSSSPKASVSLKT